MTFEPSGQSSSHSHRLRSAPLSVQAQTRQIPRAYCCCSRGLVPNPTRPSQSGHEISVAAPSYASISQASRLCFRPPAFHWQQRSNSTAQHRISKSRRNTPSYNHTSRSRICRVRTPRGLTIHNSIRPPARYLGQVPALCCWPPFQQATHCGKPSWTPKRQRTAASSLTQQGVYRRVL